jgi:hypothetical protein
MEPGGEWRDAMVNTAIEGKAVLFKETGRNEHVVHSEFRGCRTTSPYPMQWRCW